MGETGAQENNWKIEIVTWNIAGLPPPPSLDLAGLFGDDSGIFDADVIAVGLQEVDFYATRYISGVVALREEPWSRLFQEFLATKGYVKLTCGWTSRPRLMGVILVIFVSRQRLLCIHRVETKFCKTGFSGYSSHKGAVSVRLTLADGSHVAFVCAHFAPCNEAVAYRVKEYHMVLDAVKFENKNIISDDYVFWLGDLNFRVEGFSATESLRLIEHNYIEKLLEYDQLKRCMEHERAFYHFNEAPITFKPTYKFLIDSSTYDTRRSPSWCDRVLWRVESAHRQAARQLHCHSLWYRSKDSYVNSDHKPVVAAFEIKVFNFSTPALVVFRYPSKTRTWLTEQNNLCQYSVSNFYSPGMFDWIGVFKPGFQRDDEVVTWAYTITSWEESKLEDGSAKTNILFKRQHIPPPGTYILGYYSRDRSCLLALSNEFKIAASSVDVAVEAQETPQEN